MTALAPILFATLSIWKGQIFFSQCRIIATTIQQRRFLAATTPSKGNRYWVKTELRIPLTSFCQGIGAAEYFTMQMTISASPPI